MDLLPLLTLVTAGKNEVLKRIYNWHRCPPVVCLGTIRFSSIGSRFRFGVKQTGSRVGRHARASQILFLL